MASFNRVILVGNLTRDVEVRYLPSGMAVADIGLAVNDKRKGQNGEWIEEATFVDITLFGRQAEVAGEYLSKGSQALIEGRLKLDTWDDKTSGQKRSKLKVIGENMRMLGGKGGGGGRSGGPPPDDAEYGGDDRPPQSSSRAPGGGGAPARSGGGGGGGGGGGDDIPF
jgi:single-strand DNA-binding protein